MGLHRTAVHGRPSRKTRDKPISDVQRKLLELLSECTELDVIAIQTQCAYQSRDKAELAVQGLVHRGYVTWRHGTSKYDMRYAITCLGRRKISS